MKRTTILHCEHGAFHAPYNYNPYTNVRNRFPKTYQAQFAIINGFSSAPLRPLTQRVRGQQTSQFQSVI